MERGGAASSSELEAGTRGKGGRGKRVESCVGIERVSGYGVVARRCRARLGVFSHCVWCLSLSSGLGIVALSAGCVCAKRSSTPPKRQPLLCGFDAADRSLTGAFIGSHVGVQPLARSNSDGPHNETSFSRAVSRLWSCLPSPRTDSAHSFGITVRSFSYQKIRT